MAGFFANLISYWANGDSADAEQQRSDALNTKLQQQNDLDRVTYGDAWYREVEHNLDIQKAQDADVSGSIGEEFNKGFADAVKTDRQFFGDVANKTLGGILGVIPWQVWVLGLIALALFILNQTGGLERLLKRRG